MKRMSELLTFFKGQGRAKTINMPNLREAFGSLVSPWGSCYLTSPANTTTSATPGEFVKLNGTTQLTGSYLVSMPANNRLQYDGDSPRHFHIAISISFSKSGGGASDTIGFVVAKNGEILTSSEVTRTVSGTGVGSTACHADVMLSNGDYIELWVDDEESSSATISLQHMYMFMIGMIV